jgi:hypothetical protein
VIGGSLQYPTSVGFGFMPVILIASELDSNAISEAYVMYDTSSLTSSSTFFAVDELAVNRVSG